MKSFAILTDVTQCIGCEDCVAACKKANHTGADDAPWPWQSGASGLSSTRWTTIERAPEGRFVRVHCRHCLDPGCAAACPVSALRVTGEGAVAYDPSICLGCRYCLMACPFVMTRYEWESANPRVRKCILCYDEIKAGRLRQPACTEKCPTQATIFGEREALLTEARRRISAEPGKYLDHIWGEHEVGGTSVIYISDVDLTTAGWPARLSEAPVPELATRVLNTVPATFLSVGVAMAGINWVVRRRQALAAEAAEQTGADADGEVGAAKTDSERTNGEGS